MPIERGGGGGGGTTSPLTTKGDVYGFSSTNARIPVGSDTQVLTADSSQALGVKWAAASGSTDGWTGSSDTWTFASATTFTIAGVDRTSTFTTGTRLKLTQTTAKFFVVVSSSFAVDTTVTITGGSDYTLVNAAITSPFYSYQANPQGYPVSFAYTPTGTGIAGALTVNTARFAVIGNVCTVWIDVAGTSNAATFTVTAPIRAKTVAGGFWGAALMEVVDNGGALATPGRVQMQTGDTSLTLGKASNATGNWTAANTKEALGQLTYEI